MPSPPEAAAPRPQSTVSDPQEPAQPTASSSRCAVAVATQRQAQKAEKLRILQRPLHSPAAARTSELRKTPKADDTPVLVRFFFGPTPRTQAAWSSIRYCLQQANSAQCRPRCRPSGTAAAAAARLGLESQRAHKQNLQLAKRLMSAEKQQLQTNSSQEILSTVLPLCSSACLCGVPVPM